MHGRNFNIRGLLTSRLKNPYGAPCRRCDGLKMVVIHLPQATPIICRNFMKKFGLYLILMTISSSTFATTEWETLNQELEALYQQGNYAPPRR